MEKWIQGSSLVQRDSQDVGGWLVPALLSLATNKKAKRFGVGKVFISSAYAELKNDARVRSLGIDGFKQALVDAHRRGVLTLTRADLVAAMDPKDVAASETHHLNATYHFIQLGGES